VNEKPEKQKVVAEIAEVVRRYGAQVVDWSEGMAGCGDL